MLYTVNEIWFIMLVTNSPFKFWLDNLAITFVESTLTSYSVTSSPFQEYLFIILYLRLLVLSTIKLRSFYLYNKLYSTTKF